jgi:hypothetical protein
VSSIRETLAAELEEIRTQLDRLERRQREIYMVSLSLSPEDKICSDIIAEAFAHPPVSRAIQYPCELQGIVWRPDTRPIFDDRSHAWVQVRPCGAEYEGKTFLGVHIGDIARGCSCALDQSGYLHLGYALHNPLIWIPERRKTVMGSESWWGPLKSPDDLQEITDLDIENVWYVRAMRDLAKPPADSCPP